ncbi:MAG: hypothetical protein ACOX51_05640 [Myxococcota bacterium]|jgi:hypothetical protein|nr:hypothetical protein [Myxococcota bacterium]HQL56044.1 hypothetical protein [Myxococcota bacterium]
MKNYLFVILTLTLLLGCGGGDTPNEVGEDVTQDTVEPRVTLDPGQPDSKSERDLVGDPAGPLDITYSDDGLIQEVAPRDTAGEFGSFCQSNNDCFSGFCVPSEIGYICTMTCVANCPEGWNCKAVNLPDQDGILVCLPSTDLSCEINAECEAGTREVRPCGNCGEESRVCTEYCKWMPWSQCSGEGVCRAGSDQNESCGFCGRKSRLCNETCGWDEWTACEGEGVCAAGAIEKEACGQCGERSRNCTSECQWSEWSACTGTGVCSPNETTSQSCGNCGTAIVTCQEDCKWGEPGECTGEGACSPNAIDSQGCGNCGSQTRQCSARCEWGAWSTCSGQGVCAPYSETTQACGNCGTATLTCTSDCTWGPPGVCTGQGVCGQGDTAPCNSCGTMHCNSLCQWGDCQIGTTDVYEENDTRETARALPRITDKDEDATHLFANINPAFDEDWYSVYVKDETLARIDPWVQLSSVPSGQQYQLCVEYVCKEDGTPPPKQCQTSYGNTVKLNFNVDGCHTSAWSQDDSGTLIIQVKPLTAGSCQSYRLDYGA